MLFSSFSIFLVICACILRWVFYASWAIVAVVVSGLVVMAAYILGYLILQPPWKSKYDDIERNLSKVITGSAKEYYNGKISNPLVDFGLDYEEIEIPIYNIQPKAAEATSSSEQLSKYRSVLRGWFIPGSKNPKLPGSMEHELSAQEIERISRTCAICIHGGGRDRRAFMRHARYFHTIGMSCVLFDCREHGLSYTNDLGLGHATREMEDVIAVIRYLTAKDANNTFLFETTSSSKNHAVPKESPPNTMGLGKFDNVVLVGTSQGASSAICASGIWNNFELFYPHSKYPYAVHPLQHIPSYPTSIAKDPIKIPPEHFKTISCVIAENPWCTRSFVWGHIIGRNLGSVWPTVPFLGTFVSKVFLPAVSFFATFIMQRSYWSPADFPEPKLVLRSVERFPPIVFYHGLSDKVTPPLCSINLLEAICNNQNINHLHDKSKGINWKVFKSPVRSESGKDEFRFHEKADVDIWLLENAQHTALQNLCPFEWESRTVSWIISHIRT